MDIAIAQATSAEREVLVELLHAQLVEHDIVLPLERLRQAVDGPLADPRHGLCRLARAAGEPGGVAYVSLIWALEHGGKASWLEELYVVPARRGQGIGRRLLSAVIEHARRAGCAAIDLEVEASHGRAARLYQ